MDIESTYTFFSNLNDDNISFMYQGSFSDEITDKAIQVSDSNIEFAKDPAGIKKSVSLLMAECIHNIIKQTDTAEKSNVITKPGVFLTRNIGDTFCTTSAYLIENSCINTLREKLEKIDLNDEKSELYSMFSDMLIKSGYSEKKDMLQGMVEVAKKSGNKLEYDFDTAGVNWSYFYMQTIISGTNVNDTTLSRYNLHVTAAKDFHRRMKDKNVLLIYKGDFSQKAVIFLLRMLEKNLQQSQFENMSDKKVMFHIITEMLQNVSKHSVVTDGAKKGIFLVGKNVKGFFISTGNFVSSKKVRNLRDQLNQINSLGLEERNSLYRVILKTGILTENGGAGLGLIDIARETKNKFAFNFSDVGSDVTFFSLGVNY
ncbi:MAG: hypothetical protein HY958_01360 [Bacteroidia bacterium]|nr:hypothetical protein [Bacteroidia bacterium]